MMRGLLLGLLFWAKCSGWEDVPRCYWDIVDNYFEERVVKKSFELYAVWQSSWQPLYVDLSRNATQAKARIKLAAKKLNPNPLEHPFDSKKAEEILIDVERQIFFATINNWRVWDDKSIAGMFAYIQEQNAKRLKACK